MCLSIERARHSLFLYTYIFFKLKKIKITKIKQNNRKELFIFLITFHTIKIII